MPDNRPAIPADTQLLVCTRAGHKCSVDGVTSALEIAHIIDWAASHDDTPENLLLLCANCHTRSHKEKWSRKTLRYYRDHPFVNRGDARAYRPTRLPYPSLGPLFKGREDFLIDLRTSLEANFAAAVRGHTVHGMGGVGKTRAAVEYAWRFAGEYTALLFVEADSPESLSRNLAALSAPNVLDLPQQHEPEQAMQEQAVMRWLQTHPGWLLIIDNADTKEALFAVEDRLAQLRDGHVIITTRRTNCSGSFESLDLGVLTREDATDFLLARTEGHRTTTPDDDDRALVLADLLDGLALALEQAAAYIRELRLSFADYITRWQSLPTEALAWHDEVTMHYPRSLAITYQTSINQLSDPAREFFRVLSWFAPDPIPIFALDSKHAPASARTLIAELENLSLAQRNEDSSNFTVHRLIQQITRQRQRFLTPPTALLTALAWLDGLMPSEIQDVHVWPVAEPLSPHAQVAAILAAEHNISDPTASLLNQVALLYKSKANYAASEPLYRQAIAIEESASNKDNPTVATYLNNLAVLLHRTNRPVEAELLFKRIIKILENKGSDHITSYVGALSNLAQLLQFTSRLVEAEPLMRQALAITEAAVDKDHHIVALCLNNLAGLFMATNRLAEAEPLIHQALTLYKTDCDKGHSSVTTSLSNLAGLLQATNRQADAEPLIRQALADTESALGKSHPEVSTHLNNLACLLMETNRHAEAEPLLRQALAITENALGITHPEVAIRLNNLAILLKDTNRLAEAESLIRRAIDIGKSSLGTNDSTVAASISTLATLLHASNRLTEAEPLMRQALAIVEAIPGMNHSTIVIRLNNLTALLHDTNSLAEAEPLMRRALAIGKASLGNNPNVAISHRNLATLLQETNRLSEAEPLMRSALEIFVELERATGHKHPHFRNAVKGYAILLMEMGDSETQALEKINTILAPDNIYLPVGTALFPTELCLYPAPPLPPKN